MKLTLNVLEKHRDEDRRWPRYVFGGRMRTSTVALILAFLAVWWVYDVNHAETAPKPAAPQIVPPGFVPDPNYTWVPRTRVQPSAPENTYVPTPTSTVPPAPTLTTPPPPPPTTTSPPPFQLPCLLPPPFCPPSTSPAPPPPQQPTLGPGPSPTSAPPAR